MKVSSETWTPVLIFGAPAFVALFAFASAITLIRHEYLMGGIFALWSVLGWFWIRQFTSKLAHVEVEEGVFKIRRCHKVSVVEWNHVLKISKIRHVRGGPFRIEFCCEKQSLEPVVFIPKFFDRESALRPLKCHPGYEE